MNATKTGFKIIGLSGSLRHDSTNTALIQLANELRPKDKIAEIEIVSYKDVPLYDGDIEASGIPKTVLDIAEKIRQADAVYVSTPEYNYSFSAAIKNIIDWLTRCSPNPLTGKPIAIASVSAGPSGGLRAQYDLRKVFLYSKVHIMDLPELAISANYLKFSNKVPITTNDE